MDLHETINIVHDLYKYEKNVSGLIQRLRPYIAPFHTLLPLVPKGSRVLDIGCGSGLWAGLLIQTGQADSVYGFDASEKAIAVANRMLARITYGREKLVFEYRKAEDGLPDEQFDVVSMIDVVHHIPPKFQQQAILDAWSRVKTGGIFLYKDMAAKPWYCGVMNRLHDLASAKEWIHFCPLADVENTVKLCMAAGKIENSGSCRMFFWYQHEWRVWRKV